MKSRPLNYVVGGLQPLTMIDFPGKLASVIFAQGCNLRCRFCYNKTLLADTGREKITWESIIEFLKDRQGFIEGVVFSGGEPCKQEGFIHVLKEVKELGFETALHTNGFYPETVESAIELSLLDYIAVDLKGSFEKYHELTGSKIDALKFEYLIKTIADSGIRHEVRTTVHPDIITETEIVELAERLSKVGIEKYVLQKFQHGEALDHNLKAISSMNIKAVTYFKLREMFEDFEIRGDTIAQEILSSEAA
ncbi:MAG: anaerobic ribonucleoside-triphosphate reductase activating protein [Candidatus Rifleibacteriota bacterium]